MRSIQMTVDEGNYKNRSKSEIIFKIDTIIKVNSPLANCEKVAK